MNKSIEKICGYISLIKNILLTKLEYFSFYAKPHYIKKTNYVNCSKFLNYYKERMPYCDFSLLKKNIKNIKIYHCKLKKGIAGYYDLKRNECYYSNKKFLYHELNHMASSEAINNNVFSGFKQNAYGIGINEAYTEVLTHRYFNVTYKTYDFIINIMNNLDTIIGSNIMENLYYTADLKGLIKEMNNFITYGSIKTFIINMDYLYRSMITSSKNITEKNIALSKIKTIYLILVKMYLKKIENEHKFTQNEIKNKLYLFCYSLINETPTFKEVNVSQSINPKEIFNAVYVKKI